MTDGRYFDLWIATGAAGVTLIVMMGLLAQSSTETQKARQPLEQQKAEIEQNAELQAKHLEEQKKIADAARRNKVDNPDGIKFLGYTKNTVAPPDIRPEYLPNPEKFVKLYDQYSVCIGYAYRNQIVFDIQYQGQQYNPNACIVPNGNTVPSGNTVPNNSGATANRM